MDSQSVLQALDVAVVIQEPPDGRITYANEKATSLLGLTREEILDRTADDARWSVFDSAGHRVVGVGHPGLRALRDKEPVYGAVLGIDRGDAERMWISASAIPELLPDGSVARVIVSFTDITAHQRRIQEQGAIYRTVFASMTEGLAIHAKDGSILAVNQAAERALGLTEDQMSGRAATDPLWRLIREDGSAATGTDIPSERVLSTGETAGPTILGVHRPSGGLTWLSVRADPLLDLADGTMVGAIATFTDVTQAREMQNALETSRAQSQRILEAIPGVVYQYAVDAAGEAKLTIVGGRTLEVLGITDDPSHIDYDTLVNLLGEAEQEELRRAIISAVEGRRPFLHTTRAELPGLGTRWLRVIGAPESTATGLLYTGVIVDVSAEHKMAEALRLTQRREAMAQMSAGIAHNFNNMLEVILPNVEMARERVEGLEREMLEDAERAAHRAADLVKRMLDIGRSDFAKEDESCDLVPIVREGLHLTRRTLDPTIQLLESVRIAAAPVRGRASTLQQVLLNLLFNARDAVRDVASPQISVELHADGERAVRLTVRDNGHGIPATVLKRLGEPFFTTKPIGEGTGLGLASVIRAVEEAGGSWDVNSTVGQGSAFSLHFPLQIAAAEGVPEREQQQSSVPGGTVIIIDDEELVRDVLCRQVTMAGFAPMPFSSAEQALRSLESAPPSDLRCILLDLSMPGISGTRALPLLHLASPGTPIIVVSGHSIGEHGLGTAAAVLQKPLGFRDLRATLLQVVRQS
jgi:PAS domain S-box-containing protein